MEGGEEPSSDLRFFRILLPDFSKRMPIPRAFMKHKTMKKEKSKRRRASLVNPNGISWDVRVCKEGEDVFFEGESWMELCKANVLGLGYFLLFCYEGDMVFSFRAFNLTACEITTYSSIPPPPPPPPKSEPRSLRPEAESSEEKPHFEATINDYNLTKSYLHIPVGFRDSCGLLEKKKVTLVDPKGRQWPVRLHHLERNVGNTIVSQMHKGWLVFARGNALVKGDTCNFVLTTEGEETVIHVQIFRLGESRTPDQA